MYHLLSLLLALVVVEQAAAAPTRTVGAKVVKRDASRTYGDYQTYNKGLGAIYAPSVTQSGNSYYTNGSGYSSLLAALQQSCTTQYDNCVSQATAQWQWPFSSTDCSNQNSDCKNNAKSASSATSPPAVGGSSSSSSSSVSKPASSSSSSSSSSVSKPASSSSSSSSSVSKPASSSSSSSVSKPASSSSSSSVSKPASSSSSSSSSVSRSASASSSSAAPAAAISSSASATSSSASVSQSASSSASASPTASASAKNWQTYTGAAGGISAPAVTQDSAGKWVQSGTTYDAIYAALQQSCYAQASSCSSSSGSFDKSVCWGSQVNDCLTAASNGAASYTTSAAAYSSSVASANYAAATKARTVPGDLQTFTGALAGIAAPAVTGTIHQWVVAGLGGTFYNLIDALSQSCWTQQDTVGPVGAASNWAYELTTDNIYNKQVNACMSNAQAFVAKYPDGVGYTGSSGSGSGSGSSSSSSSAAPTSSQYDYASASSALAASLSQSIAAAASSSAAAYSSSLAASASAFSSSAAAYSASISISASVAAAASSAAAYSSSVSASAAAYSASLASAISSAAAAASSSSAAAAASSAAAAASSAAAAAAAAASESAASAAAAASSSAAAAASSASAAAAAAAASATAVPSGWSRASSFCIAEGPSGRALTGANFADGAMTWQKCTDYCASKGFALAGVEYSSECFCGAVLSNGASLSLTSGNCNMACSGQSAQTCGGPSALTLFVSSDALTTGGLSADYTSVALTLPGTWVAASTPCIQEGTSGRALAADFWADPAMTVPKCLNYCAGKGYQYAGLEYYTECRCGNALVNGASLDRVGQCNTACGGAGAQMCGGAGTLSLYQDPAKALTNTVLGAYSYQGCIQEVAGRALTGSSIASDDMTLAKCQAAAQAGGYLFFGVEYGRECYMGNSLVNGASLDSFSTQCNMPCAGDYSKTCGGPNAITLYSTLTGLTAVGT